MGEKIHLVKARTDGTGSTVDLLELTNGTNMRMTLPEWSPAGDWIACSDSQNQLILVHPDGGAFREIGESGPVAWAPEGRILYQIRYRDCSLVAIDVTTGKGSLLRELGDLIPYATNEPARRMSLTRDGSRVVYSVLRPREEIWILDGIKPAVSWLAKFWPF